MGVPLFKKEKESEYLTIAFYNLENLFDTFDNEQTRDDDFLPSSAKRWTPRRYRKKVRKLGYTISQIGSKISGLPPVIVGLAEVENKMVVEDLIASKFLKEINYIKSTFYFHKFFCWKSLYFPYKILLAF